MPRKTIYYTERYNCRVGGCLHLWMGSMNGTNNSDTKMWKYIWPPDPGAKTS